MMTGLDVSLLLFNYLTTLGVDQIASLRWYILELEWLSLQEFYMTNNKCEVIKTYWHYTL